MKRKFPVNRKNKGGDPSSGLSTRILPWVFRIGFISLFFVLLASVINISVDSSGIEVDVMLSEGAQERLLVERKGVSSTLYVIQSPHDDSILGVWLALLSDTSGSSMLLYIPSGVYLRDHSGEFEGYVSVGDLRYAGEVLDKNRDIEYAIWQISNLTGVSIDSYIWIDSNSLDVYSEIFGDISDFPVGKYTGKYRGGKDAPNSAYLLHSFVDRFSVGRLLISSKRWEEISNGTFSNMSALDIVAHIRKTKNILNAGNTVLFDLSQPWATQELTTNSNRLINVVNYQGIDEHIKYADIVKGRDIEKEQVRVEVYNASGIAEIAYRYARKLKNSGLSVVRYENAPDIIEKSQLYITRPERFPVSIDLVKKILVVDAQEINSRPSFITTGDIVILLGKDMQSEVDWK